MQSSILVCLMSTLSPKELSHFRKFMYNAYPGHPDSVLALFDRLHKAYPKFKGEAIMREKIFTKLYPNQVFKKTSLNPEASKIKDALEDFLCVYKMDMSKSRIQFLCEDIYERAKYKDEHKDDSQEAQHIVNRLKAYIKKLIHKWSIHLEKNYQNKHTYFHQRFLLEDFKIRFDTWCDGAINVETRCASKYLDLSSLVHHLRFAATEKSKEKATGRVFNVDTAIIDNLVTTYEADIENIPVLKLYKYVYVHSLAISIEEKEASYRDLVSFIGECRDDKLGLESNDMYNAITTALNFCNTMTSTKACAYYLKTGFELFQQVLSLDAKEDAFQVLKFKALHYKNIVMTGLRHSYINQANCMDWIEEFMHQHSDLLGNDEYSDSYRRYCEALYYFYRGEAKDYIKSKAILASFMPTGRTPLDIRVLRYTLQMKLAYEMKDHDEAETLIVNFRMFKPRLAETPGLAAACQNFYELYRRLVRCTFEPDIKKADWEDLTSFYNELERVPSSAWFSRKMS